MLDADQALFHALVLEIFDSRKMWEDYQIQILEENQTLNSWLMVGLGKTNDKRAKAIPFSFT